MGHQFLPDRPVDEARSAEAVRQGGLPLRARRRIWEMNQAQRPLVTSTLGPAETLVAGMTGLEPVSQVMGSSVYHVGFGNYRSSWTGGELQNLTVAYEQARSRALSRMQQEAALLHAHAVVDVRFERRGYEWADELVEFTAVGTAVRLRGAPPTDQPALTLLTTGQLWKLHHAGYWPVGIAIGNCFWYEPHADCASEGSWFSQELPAHTRAATTSRDLAVERFRGFAHHFNAHGVVGVKVVRYARDHEWETENNNRTTVHTAFHIEMVLMGTAVVRRGDAAPPPRPKLVVDLRDLVRRPSR
jgi:uncharacterized protein YbjQ (UPF0145 family)